MITYTDSDFFHRERGGEEEGERKQNFLKRGKFGSRKLR